MEQIKEMWQLVFEWLGNGKKMILGSGFLLIGIIGQALSGAILEQGPFLFMSIGLMCFVNALFSRLASSNINLLLYLMINLLAAEIGIGITASDTLEGVTLYLVWFLCVILAWVLQIFQIHIPEAPRRAVLAFFETILSLIALAAVFLIPIFLHVWGIC